MPLTPDEKDTLSALEHQLRGRSPAYRGTRARTPGTRRAHPPGTRGRAVERHAGGAGLITSARAALHRQEPASTARAPTSDEDDALTE
jgi:hypothetical protein